MMTSHPIASDLAEEFQEQRVAMALFIQQLETDRVDLADSERIQAVARESAGAARVLFNELGARGAGAVSRSPGNTDSKDSGPSTAEPETDPGPTTGPAGMSPGATNRQDSTTRPSSEGEPGAMDSDETTELGSIDGAPVLQGHDKGRILGYLAKCAHCHSDVGTCTCPNGLRAVLGWLPSRGQRATEEEEAAGQPTTETVPVDPYGDWETSPIKHGSHVTWRDGSRSGVVVVNGSAVLQIRESGTDGVLKDAVSVARHELRLFESEETETGSIPAEERVKSLKWSRGADMKVIRTLENQRAAAVWRADKIAAERDYLDGQVTRLNKRVRDLEAEAEVLAGRVTAAKLEVQDLKEERDELQQLQDLQHRRFTETLDAWREAHPGNELSWPDYGDHLSWMLHRIAALESTSTEVESISEERLANLERCDPQARVDVDDSVVLEDGRSGRILCEWRAFKIDLDKGTTCESSEYDTYLLPQRFDDFESEHCGEQATMDAGSIASEAGGEA